MFFTPISNITSKERKNGDILVPMLLKTKREEGRNEEKSN